MYINDITKLNNDVYSSSYPIFTNENMLYHRNEKNGYITCYSNKATFLGELIINPVALKILELCDGNTTPPQIVDKMLKIFKNTIINLNTLMEV